MFNEPDTSERQGGEERNKKLLLRLEQVAHVTTTAAFALTIVLVTTGLASELNTVVDVLFGTLGWTITGVAAIAVLTAAFACYERHVGEYPRIVLTAGVLLALAGVADLAANLWVLWLGGFPESVNWGAYALPAGIVLVVGTIATARHSIATPVLGQLRANRHELRGVALALLVATSVVALPFMGGISPDGGMGHDGIASAAEEGTQEWAYTGHSNNVYGVAVDESTGMSYSASWDNEVHAINPDGTQKWAYTGFADNVESVAVDDESGTIYAGAGGSGSGVHAINPDGTQKWTYSGHGGNVKAIAIDESTGTIYTASYDNEVHAINPDGTQKWTYTGPGSGENLHSVAVDESSGTIYTGGTYDGEVHAINNDGTRKWIYSDHGVTHDITGIGVDDASGTIYSGTDSNELHAINPDGTQKWTYTDIGSVLAVDVDESSGTIYSGSGSNFYALNPDGTREWEYTDHGGLVNGLAVDESSERVYSGANDNEVHAVGSVPGTEPVSGTVTDRDDNSIEGAWVGADHPDVDSATTNATGYYELAVPEAGTYDVTADDGDYVSSKTVDVPDGGLTGVDFQLGPADPAGQPVGLVEDELGMFPADDTHVVVYERNTEYKSIEDGMSVDTWHEETWTKTETASFNWENRTHVDLVDGRYYRLELEGPHGHWEDSGFLYNESDMIDRTIWLEPETEHLDSNGDGTAGGSSSSGTNGAGTSTPTPTAYEDGTYPTATEQEGFGPTALGKCQTLDGQDGVEVEYWDPDYETAELEANLTTDDSTTYYIHKIWDDPRGYYRGCIADSMTDNASAEADVGLNHTALDGEGEVLTSGRQSFSAPTFGPSGKAPASTGERAGLLAAVLGALGVLWFGGNRYVPASSVKSWPSESISPAFGIGAPIVAVLGLDLAGGGVISAGVATGLAQIAPFAGIVGVTVGGYYALRWIRAPPAS